MIKAGRLRQHVAAPAVYTVCLSMLRGLRSRGDCLWTAVDLVSFGHGIEPRHRPFTRKLGEIGSLPSLSSLPALRRKGVCLWAVSQFQQNADSVFHFAHARQ